GPRSGSTLFPYTTLFRSRVRASDDENSFCAVLARGHGFVAESGVTVEFLTARGINCFRNVAQNQHQLVGHIQALVRIVGIGAFRSEEHTSELQSPCNLVC